MTKTKIERNRMRIRFVVVIVLLCVTSGVIGYGIGTPTEPETLEIEFMLETCNEAVAFYDAGYFSSVCDMVASDTSYWPVLSARYGDGGLDLELVDSLSRVAGIAEATGIVQDSLRRHRNKWGII